MSTQTPQIGEIWLNQYRQERYEITSIALDCETDQPYLHYRSIDDSTAALRSRSLAEFLGMNRNGEVRFVRVEEDCNA